MARALTALGQASVSFKIVSGIAKPNDLATLGIFQGLQRAINTARGFGLADKVPLVEVDGEIGDRTRKAAEALSLEIRKRQPDPSWPGLIFSINSLALNAALATNKIAAAFGFSTDTTAVPAPPEEKRIVRKEDLPNELAPAHKPGGVHWGWWVGGGLLLVIGGFFAVRAFRKKSTFTGGADFDDYEPADGDFIDV